jgi:polyhydroxybutyrate depolymerase
MKSENWKRMQAVASIGVCLGMAFITSGAQAQETKETMQVNDVDRTYIVRLPKGYDHEQKYPVAMLLHGMNQETADIERLTRFDDLADKDSIIAVYPSALNGRWNVGVRPPARQRTMMPMGRGGRHGGGGFPGGGQSGGRSEEERGPAPADDIAFLNQMLDQMATQFSVDTARIYVTGLSEGGLMAIKVGCAMADRIAAIAPVGAAMPKTMVCLPSRPMPVVMINGTSDPVVPYGGGTEHNLQLPVISVEDSAKAWAKIDRCAEKPTQTKVKAHEKGGMETKVETYDDCQQGAQVVSYSVKGGGNTWPGGEQYEVEKQVGKTSQDLNANETIWSFLVNKKLAVKSGTDSSPSAK